MSFALPSVKHKPALAKDLGLREGTYGVPNLMTDGFADVKSTLEMPHKLFESEKNYFKNRDHMNMVMLRNVQGLHAPLRIAMERNAAKKIGRLPFLPSSNIMLDVLTGRDIEVGPEDIYGIPEFIEVGGQPHAVVERTLGLL